MFRGSALSTTIAAVVVGLTVGTVGPAAAKDRATPAAGCSGADTVVTPRSVEPAARAVRCLLEAERAARQLPAYRQSGPLATAARRHASDMARSDYFGHVSRDGRKLCDRVRATGYLRGSKRRYRLGETLVYGIKVDATPARLVANLLRSTAHRRLLLNADFRDVGVGLAAGLPLSGDRRDGATVVVDLGRRIANTEKSFKGAKACTGTTGRSDRRRVRLTPAFCVSWRQACMPMHSFPR